MELSLLTILSPSCSRGGGHKVEINNVVAVNLKPYRTAAAHFNRAPRRHELIGEDRAIARSAGASRPGCVAAEYASHVFEARTFVTRISYSMTLAYHVENEKMANGAKNDKNFSCLLASKGNKVLKNFHNVKKWPSTVPL